MKLIVVNSIHGAKKYFSALTPEHSFQSYSVQCAIEKSTMRGWYYSAVKRPWRFFWHGPRYRTYIVVDGEDNPILIAPVLMNAASGLCSCAGTTTGSAADYTDFLYAAAPDSEIQQALTMALTEISRSGYARLSFGQLASDSKTFDYLSALGLELAVEKESRSVLIDLGGGGFERYFASLGKHAKQNVRTAYNRLSRDGRACHFQFYSRAGIGSEMDSAAGKNSLALCEKLYFNRQESRYRKFEGGSRRSIAFFSPSTTTRRLLKILPISFLRFYLSMERLRLL